MIADPKERNRAINAAYARLWLHDSRFQWAGLAAFASKQVGCGLLHAAHAIERIQAEEDAQQDLRDSRRDWGLFTKDQMAPQHQLLREYQTRDAQNPVPLDVWLAGDVQSVVQQQFQHVYDMMALGNMEIIYAFEAIEAGDIAGSVKHFASHEQQNILQPAIYEDPQLIALLRSNHVSYVTGLPSGLAQAIELTLASQCSAVDDGRTIGFGNNPFANLADVKQRMAFVLRAANRFDQMLHDFNRDVLTQSIKDIAAGGGVQ